MKKNLLFSFVLIFYAVTLSAQNGEKWSIKWQSSKVFIENKGQFGSDVAYAIDQDRTKIYFSSKGLTYSFFKVIPKKEEEEEREREREGQSKVSFTNIEDWQEKEKEERRLNIKRDFVTLTWENANPNVKIEAQEETHEYFNYGGKPGTGEPGFSNARAFKKIVYKNLYPNIDVEYIFHPTEGIKYSLILHPGADISQVKMKYTDADKMKIDLDGDLHIRTAFGDIIDHAPVTFYANNPSSTINSKFVRTDNTVSFLLEGYDKTKEVVIDPWTQTPTLSNSNGVWECEKDAAGNIYIIGGDVPMKLLKYNSTGTLQWTFVTTYDTSAAGGGEWLGTFATDLNGNSYVTCGSTAALTKVNTSGTQVYAVTGGSVDEYWNIAFNCDQTKLIIGGTRLNAFPTVKGYGTIFDINTATGGVTSTVNVGYTSPGPFGINNPDEVRSITSSKNARYYYLTLDSMGCIDQNFSACPGATSLYKINDGFNLGYKCENYRPNNGNAGIMAIRANGNFVYTHNGTNIQKRSLTTGAILTSAVITGGTSVASFGTNAVGNSGIDIDSCGNVYVGSGNAVIKYDANLVQLSSSATAFKVYDVCVSYGGNVVATGATGTDASTTRTGYVESFAMGACNPQTLVCCDANVCAAGPFCTTSPNYTLSPVTAGGTWSGTGVNASGVFSPSTAGSGTFTIVYTLACGSSSIDIVVNPCATLTVCINGSTLNVSGGTPSYTWQTQTTVTSCTACAFPATCFPPGCQTTSTTWTTVATGTSTFTPGSYPVKVTDSGGNSYTITTAGSVPACPAVCTTPTLSLVGQTNVSCNGGSNGSATVTAAPAGTYTYTWQSGNLNGAAQSGLSAGVYTVTASAGASCSSTMTVNITEPVVLSIVPVQTASVACFGQSTGAASVTVNGGTTPYSINWSSGGTGVSVSNLPIGTYTASVTDAHSCAASGTVTINGANPIITQEMTNPALCGASNGSATVIANGGTPVLTYSWSTGATGQTLSGVAAGTYTCYVTDGNSCVKTAIVTIPSTGGPTATAIQTSSVTCAGLTNGTASVSISGGTPSYTVNWSNSTTGMTTSGLGVGTYTAIVTDSNNCVSTATVTIDEPTPIAITFTDNSPSACTSSTGSVTANATGGTGVITYSWSTGATGQTLGNVPAGSYTVTATDANNCTKQASVNIVTVNGPTLTPVATTTVTCHGGSNGTASVSISGGTPSYTVNWSGGATGTTATGLSGGVYTVTVTDASSCVSIDTVSIAQPPAITITANSSPTGCTNSVGTATANATGGTGAMTYTWSNTQTGATASGLGNSTYTVVSTDANGCKDSTTVLVGITPGPTVSISGSTPTGCTNSVGTATATVSGGTGAITYTWSNSQTGASASGLGQNTYTVVAVDANGCKDSTTVSIGVSGGPTVTINSTPTGCTNSIGSATASVTGGTGTITYTWSNSQTGNTATGLGQNTYTVVISDANGCKDSTTVSIGVTASPTVTIDSTHAVKCFGQANGTGYSSVTGGTPGYGMTWSNGASGIAATNLANGTYTIVVTDANGCKDSATATITQPAPLTETISAVQDENCNRGNGAATITVGGGTTSYSYAWSSGQTTSTVTNFHTGTYTVVVTDANGCTIFDTAHIGNIAGPTATVTAQSNVTCFGYSNGAATVTAAGGTPTYTYTWNNGATGSSVDSLISGGYVVTITDAAACTYTVPVYITQPNAITVTVTTVPVSCSGGNNGSATANATGGTAPYVSAIWSNGQTSGIATNLTAGTYTVVYTDTNSCTGSGIAVITENPPVDTLQITGSLCLNDPSVTLTAPSISSGSQHQWSLNSIVIPGATTYTYSGNSSTYGGYSVMWYYNGCRYITTNVFVTVSQDLGNLPQTNIFTPNEDNINDAFIPFSTSTINAGSTTAINALLTNTFEDYELTIYDRWGILLFKTNIVTDSWNGKTTDGKDCSAGTYYWIAKYKAKCSKNTGEQNIKGFVQLIR
jgi:gliding motility-associated-like protein